MGSLSIHPSIPAPTPNSTTRPAALVHYSRHNNEKPKAPPRFCRDICRCCRRWRSQNGQEEKKKHIFSIPKRRPVAPQPQKSSSGCASWLEWMMRASGCIDYDLTALFDGPPRPSIKLYSRLHTQLERLDGTDDASYTHLRMDGWHRAVDLVCR